MVTPTLAPIERGEVTDGKRFVQRRDDSASDEFGVLAGRGALSDDPELVASDPGNGVHFADGCDETVRYGSEQLIANLVPMGIVDNLESVEVDEEHGDATPAPASDRQGLRHSIFEESGIGELGDRIVQSLVAHLVEQRHAVESSRGQAGHAAQSLFHGAIGLETVTI